jgi:MFS family permease
MQKLDQDAVIVPIPLGTDDQNHAHPSGVGDKVYTAGTLRYTQPQLASLFGWLLWGDFAFTFFEAIFSRFMPLYLKDLQASNSLIGVMTGSIAGVINVFFAPNISQWSDRCRSRWGRRIPFLFCVTPITVISLILIGYAPEIGGWAHGGILGSWMPKLGKREMILGLLCIFVISYHSCPRQRFELM